MNVLENSAMANRSAVQHYCGENFVRSQCFSETQV
jgi:hypothetical protein